MHDGSDALIRRAIGGDPDAVSELLAGAPHAPHPCAVAVAGVLAARVDWMRRAASLAVTSRDRQIVAIATMHLAGDGELVDVLGRDHLAEHPDSVIVAWIVSRAAADAQPRRR